MRFLLALALILAFTVSPLFNAARAEITLSEIKGSLLTQSSAFTDRDDPLQPWLQHDEAGASIGAAALFNGPDFLNAIWSPRIMLGVQASVLGETNYVYADLYWDRYIHDKLWLAGFFGLAVHDGTIDQSKRNPNYYRTRHLGSRVLFHLGPEIGYDITEHWNLSLAWMHISNGWILNGFDLDAPNEGMDQLGMRIGYKF